MADATTPQLPAAPTTNYSWTSLTQVQTPLSGITNLDALLWQGRITYNYELPQKYYITYSFDVDAALAAPNSLRVKALTDDQQNAVEFGLIPYVEEVTGITFVKTSAGANTNVDLFFGTSKYLPPLLPSTDYYNYTYSSNDSGNITFLDIHDSILLNNSPGYEYYSNLWSGQGYAILLREIGHALGLKTPSSGTPNLPSNLDNQTNTVMSLINTNSVYPTEFTKYDLNALGWLYGFDGLLGSYGLTINSAGQPVPLGGPPNTLTAGASDIAGKPLLAQA